MRTRAPRIAPQEPIDRPIARPGSRFMTSLSVPGWSRHHGAQEAERGLAGASAAAASPPSFPPSLWTPRT